MRTTRQMSSRRGLTSTRRTTRRSIIGFWLAATLALGVMPAAAQDADEPSPSAKPTPIPAQTESGRPDLYLDMPYFIGGFEPEIVMVRGDEHFSSLAPEDPTRLALEGLLETTRAEVNDLVSGYALVSQEGFFAFVVGIRVDGVEQGTLWPAYGPILISDLEDPSTEQATVGDKDVTVITSVGEDGEYVELYAYDEGDTIWIVQGPSDVAETTLYNLPDPMEPDAAEDGG